MRHLEWNQFIQINFYDLCFFFNQRLCKVYDEIADKVSKQTTSTAELVETIEFLNKSIEETVFKLDFKIAEARRRLMFLLDYAVMPSI